MEKVRRFGRYFVWCVAAATLVFCLGSLHLFARGLDEMTRDLRLDSAPGKGSTFSVTIPIRFAVPDREEEETVSPSVREPQDA